MITQDKASLLTMPGLGGGTATARPDISPCPVYPLRLASGSIPADVLSLYRAWAQREHWAVDPIAEPWVPVGRCGPVLVLGHCRPLDIGAPLPAWCFQPVRLDMDDYSACLEQLIAARQQVAEEDGGARASSTAVSFPARHILPCGRLAALQFLLEYFPNDEEAALVLRSQLARGGTGPALLPAGYEAAVDFVLRRAPVVDLRLVRTPQFGEELGEGCLPAGWSLVEKRGSSLWVASPGAWGPGAEDRLLDSLGDGWRLQILRAVDSGPGAREPARGDPGEQGRIARRPRVVIETQARAVGNDAGSGERFTPGEIVISERLAGELERYDPRRPGRDPAKVFLRELSEAIRCGASDLHIEPGAETARIRARVDGVMEEWLEMGADFGQAVVGAAKELAGLPAERFMPQDGSCTIHHCGVAVGARVSSYPIRRRRQKLVFRLLPRRGAVPALSSLLNPWQARLMMRAASSPQGLVLVCGPTGSGKTTTLFSVLDALNSPERNIMTMEDPVEYEIEGLNQAEVDGARGVGWDSLLRGFLRQDPDAGLIGEVRDRETAETALRQALTGHVVFATLHTLSCARTLERLIDMGVNADMLASALTLIESQRLVRRLCVRCRVPRVPTAEERTLFARRKVSLGDTLWDPSSGGCPCCRRGHAGRVAAVELLPVVDEIVALIGARARARAFDDWMAANGLPTVFESALRLAADGTTSVSEALEWQSVWGDFEWRDSR